MWQTWFIPLKLTHKRIWADNSRYFRSSVGIAQNWNASDKIEYRFLIGYQYIDCRNHYKMHSTQSQTDAKWRVEYANAWQQGRRTQQYHFTMIWLLMSSCIGIWTERKHRLIQNVMVITRQNKSNTQNKSTQTRKWTIGGKGIPLRAKDQEEKKMTE